MTSGGIPRKSATAVKLGRLWEIAQQWYAIPGYAAPPREDGIPEEIATVAALWNALGKLPNGSLQPCDFQDQLVHPPRRNGDEIRFLVENQGNWECLVKIHEGPDYPVYLDADDRVERLGENLVDFLVTYVLRELILTSPHATQGEGPGDEQFRKGWKRVWTGAYPLEGKLEFYLQGRTLGCVSEDTVWTGSVDVPKLLEVEEVAQLEFYPPGYWSDRPVPFTCRIEPEGRLIIKHGQPFVTKTVVGYDAASYRDVVRAALQLAAGRNVDAEWTALFWTTSSGQSESRAIHKARVVDLVTQVLSSANPTDPATRAALEAVRKYTA